MTCIHETAIGECSLGEVQESHPERVAFSADIEMRSTAPLHLQVAGQHDARQEPPELHPAGPGVY